MILTGQKIEAAVANGDITIAPFVATQVNPNSYNYRIGDRLFIIRYNKERDTRHFVEHEVSDGRWLLKKGSLYLANTHERIGSSLYVPSLIGRSSIGRLGLFVQVSANLGHLGSVHRWTLELFPTVDIYIYPGQILGQVSFWEAEGNAVLYSGIFGRFDDPVLSHLDGNAILK